jgi:hypothetical protein
MNDMIVGMENLPNVFINRITIVPSGDGFEIKIQLGMYDHKDNPSWKNKIDNLKIKIVFESRTDRIGMLNDGTMSLYDYEPSPQGYSTTEPFDCYVISADDFGPVSTEGDYELNVRLFTYTKPLRENLNVYAACFIGGLGFGIPMFDKFYGPMSAEKIIVGGELNTLSNYFYYPDTNEEYGGPVHLKPDGSYMEGSQHSEEPHKDVILVSEENYKIQAQNFDMPDFAQEELSSYVTGRYSRQTSTLPSSAAETGTQQQTGLRPPTTYVTPTGVPTPGTQPNSVTVKDANVPNSTPDRIY